MTNTSPLYPRSNGQVERTIQTIKSLIKKSLEDSQDLEIALLELRNTPVVGNHSPAQLLMSRKLRSKTPMSASLLRPKVCDTNLVNIPLCVKQSKTAAYYDKHAHSRCSYNLNDCVNVHNVRKQIWEKGRVVGFASTPSSYIVRLDQSGSVLQRNSFHLKLRPPNSNNQNVPPSWSHLMMIAILI